MLVKERRKDYRKEGRIVGREEGRKEGKKERRIIGREEGRKEVQKSVILKNDLLLVFKKQSFCFGYKKQVSIYDSKSLRQKQSC